MGGAEGAGVDTLHAGRLVRSSTLPGMVPREQREHLEASLEMKKCYRTTLMGGQVRSNLLLSQVSNLRLREGSLSRVVQQDCPDFQPSGCLRLFW